MAYETIQVESISPHIGAEIHRVDLSKPLGNQTFQEVRDAQMAHLVIFFRDQDITLAQQKAFARLFGELHIHPACGMEDHNPEVLVIHADAGSTYAAGNAWHTDVSADEEPPMGSILRLTELPDVGGDTLFASTYAANEALSEPMRRFLSGRTAAHEWDHVYSGRDGHRERGRDNEFPRAEHPVVRTHPVTGRKGLYVIAGFTSHIKDMKPRESRTILKMLYHQIRTPAFQCRFRWRKNSIAFWDNRCAQHHALWDYYPETRHGYRVTIKGDCPF